jgi:hypothetical protein
VLSIFEEIEKLLKDDNFRIKCPYEDQMPSPDRRENPFLGYFFSLKKIGMIAGNSS